MSDELNPYPGNLKHHKVEPLLSDEQVLDLRSYPPEEIRDIYEAARAKDAELIQRLVDFMQDARNSEDAPFNSINDIALFKGISLAAEYGFKPSDQWRTT